MDSTLHASQSSVIFTIFLTIIVFYYFSPLDLFSNGGAAGIRGGAGDDSGDGASSYEWDFGESGDICEDDDSGHVSSSSGEGDDICEGTSVSHYRNYGAASDRDDAGSIVRPLVPRGSTPAAKCSAAPSWSLVVHVPCSGVDCTSCAAECDVDGDGSGGAFCALCGG